MNSFKWGKHFITGLNDVDEQHHYLVDLINQFSDLLAENKYTSEDINRLFKDLADYSAYHFREEETLMTEAGLDKRHLDKHFKIHQDFLHELGNMFAAISPEQTHTAKALLDFLINWLAYHILGTDQNMARQVAFIKSGLSPQEAYDKEEREADTATEPLLAALNNLFIQISERNRELVLLNQSLERKVAERTRALSDVNAHLEELSLTDTLTNLPNRRYAMNQLESLWKNSKKSASPLTCMMIDADQFKEVNDNHGHDAGDQVLIKLAKTLQDCFRNDDIVCRLGGDEFFVICPDTDHQGGMYIAEQVRKTVSDLKVPTGDGFWDSSISVGVATMNAQMENFEMLIKLADRGVYKAKQDGNNCVRAV